MGLINHEAFDMTGKAEALPQNQGIINGNDPLIRPTISRPHFPGIGEVALQKFG